MIRILLEASGLAHGELRAALEQGDGIAVIGDDRPGTLAQRIEAFAPDVVLLDSDGDEPVSSLLQDAELRHAPPVIVLVPQADSGWSAAALRAGVRAVIARDGVDIPAAVAAVAAGYVVLQPDALEQLVPAAVRLAPDTKSASLTQREIEVLRMMAEGLANKTIAVRLGISEHTVKFHVGSIFAKLHAGSRTEAVTTGARQGLVML